MDTKVELGMEQAQQNPDFIRIMEAFRMIKDACDKFGTDPVTNQRRDLADDEINWVVQKIVAGKKGILHPDNPFLRQDEKGDKLELEYVCGSIMEFVKQCEQTRNRDENIRVEPNLDIFNFKRFVQSKPWDRGLETNDDEKTTSHDALFEKIQGAEADLKHKHPEKYFKLVTDILDNVERNAFPDPNKYNWACEQIKKSGNLQWKITESNEDNKQEVVFKITLGGHTFERTIDFQRQMNQQQASALDRQDIPLSHADHSLANPDSNAKTVESSSQEKSKEVSIDAVVGENEQIKPKTPTQQKADEKELENSDFKNIKDAFEYNRNVHGHEFVHADENNKRDIFAKILYDYRDMPDAKNSLQTMLRNIDQFVK